MSNVKTGTFVVGQSQTEAVSLNEKTLSGVILSGSSISGSSLSFLVSVDGSNFYPLFNNSNQEVILTVGGASKAYNLDPDVFKAWLHVKARLGTSGSAVLQAGINQSVIFISG